MTLQVSKPKTTTRGAARAPDRPQRSTGPDLAGEVLSLGRGDHLCLIYDDDPVQQLEALLPFIRQGLEKGERCIYVADDIMLDTLRDAMADYEIDVDRQISRGALALWTREQWRPVGDLDSAVKEVELRDTIQSALADGFKGVRFAIEMTWTLGPDLEDNLIRHWEATINQVLTPEVPARMICQYSRARLEHTTIDTALRTHPVAIVGEDIHPNPFYEAPLILQGQPTSPIDRDRVEWMISQLSWVRAFDEERERRKNAEGALDLARSAIDELRESNAAKDGIISLVSHELKTPITVIMGYAQLLLRQLPPTDGHLDKIGEIGREADRLNRIISNLLVLASLDAGKSPEVKRLFVGPTIEQVCAEHRRRYPNREVEVNNNHLGIAALGNEVYLEQVLANFLGNAEKYSSEDEPIEINLANEDGFRMVRVLDRGIGISGDKSRLFEAFYRSPQATSTGPGLGIGLAVCKRLVEAQGGATWAKAREGGGSEFGFSLPLEDSARGQD